MSKSLKMSLALVAVVVAALAVFLILSDRGDDAPLAQAPDQALARADSPRLSTGDQAQFVEFLDFECEACIALFPVVEDLRERYGDRVEFVVRHLPLHGNSLNAALAAEAAGEQGEFEAMYRRLFETPTEWGHQEESQREVFFGYARELKLDMERFRTAFEAPATRARIEQSANDARSLGVEGTPTFFLNGEKLTPTSVEDLEQSIQAALAE